MINTSKQQVWRILFLIVACGVAFLPQFLLHADDDDDPYVSDQLVVKLEASTNATIEDINADYGTTTLSAILASRKIYLLQTAPGDDAQVIAGILHGRHGNPGDPRVDYAEANYLSDLPEGNPHDSWAWGGSDPSPSGTQYAIDMLNLPQAQVISQGSGIVVAVIDTGFKLDHPFLAGGWTAVRYDFIDDDTTPDDVANGLDEDADTLVDEAWGHGTHVAGIVRQVAPQAQIMAIRALNADGGSNVFLIAEAIDFAINNGANVINLSLGTGYDSDLLQETVAEAEAAGIVIAAAAGNFDNEVKQYPAAFPPALAVVSVDANRIKALSSSFGSWVDIAMPGVAIFSSFPTENGYAYWGGTSMATPFVAGQAALILAADITQTTAEVRTVIQSSAVSIDAENLGYAGLLGSGLGDVEAAVQMARLPQTNINVSNTTNVALTWAADPAYCHYDILRSIAPYSGYSLHANDETSPLTDNGTLGDTAVNYFYLIEWTACAGGIPISTNRIGAFDFPLVVDN